MFSFAVLLLLAPPREAAPLRVPDDCGAAVSEPFTRSERDLFVVQFARASNLADAKLLESDGAAPLQTIPENAWLCRLDRSSLDRLRDRSDVARIVPWSPGRKLAPALRHAFSTLAVRLRLTPDAHPEAVARRLAGLGLKAAPGVASSRLAPVVLLPFSQLQRVAEDPDVAALELAHPITPFMEIVRSSADVPAGRGAQAGPMLDVERAWTIGLRGQGQVVAVADTGLDTGDLATLHEDFGRVGDASNPSRVRAVVSASDLDPSISPGWEDRWDHGTSVAAIVLGNGAMSGSIPSRSEYSGSHAGIVPEAELVAECILHVDASGNVGGGFGMDPSDDLLGRAARAGARTHSLSAGTAQDGSYSWPSDEWDQAAWENPTTTFVVAAGNAGADGWVVPWDAGWTTDSCGAGWTLDQRLQPPRTGSCPFGETGQPFFTADDQACDVPYAPNMNACLVSPPLPVSPDRPPAQLVLVHEADVALDGDAGIVELDADGDGAFETSLLRVTGALPFESTVISLPAVAWTTAARLRFRFQSDGSGDGYGWNVHLVRIADGVIDGATVASPATAKNVVTVGASENVRPSARDDLGPQAPCADDGTWSEPLEPLASDHRASNGFGMAAFSSRGPTRDGRIKPDVVAPGTFLLTARSRVGGWLGTCGLGADAPDHGWFGGTSGAAPIVAGVAALVRQALHEGRHGRGSLLPIGPADPTKSFEPSGALVKALLLDGAASMGRGQYAAPFEEIPEEIPNAVAGHGRVDAMGALDPGLAWGADPRMRRLIVDERAGLRTGEAREHSFRIVSVDLPLRVRLAWTDPPPSPASSVALVNDLDVAMRLADGTTIPLLDDPAGNVNGGTLAAGSYPVGPASVVVTGARVPGQLGYPGSDAQPYALVVTGGITCAAPPPVTGLRASAEGDDVVLTWVEAADVAGHVVFDVDELSRFATRSEIARPANARFTHAGVRRDGSFRCWLVSSRNECGDVSGD